MPPLPVHLLPLRLHELPQATLADMQSLQYDVVSLQARDLLAVFLPHVPDGDFKQKLAEHEIPLYGVESFQPLQNFDLLAFSLQYELNYTTIFGMLEAARIPFRATERDARDAEHWPILIAGGPGSANPMPLAPLLHPAQDGKQNRGRR